MSLSSAFIASAKFGSSGIAAVAGALDFSAIFTSACGGGFKLLSGEYNEVLDPLLSRSEMIGIATATAVTAAGVRYGLGKLFPEPGQP